MVHNLQGQLLGINKGLTVIFKDTWDPRYVANNLPITGTVLTVVVGGNPSSSTTGVGGASTAAPVSHIAGCGIVFVNPSQMIRYRVQMLALDMDPSKPNGIPCLVRDQGTYNAAGFTVDAFQQQQIVAENVQAFKVYLSCNNGLGWAGVGLTGTGFTGWDAGTTGTSGIRNLVDAQLVTSGRPGFTTTRGSEDWFRSIPTLVRCDVTTRSTGQRSEYNTTGSTAVAYKLQTQSLVFSPRHSGLPMD
jgi:hypothetical protein